MNHSAFNRKPHQINADISPCCCFSCSKSSVRWFCKSSLNGTALIFSLEFASNSSASSPELRSYLSSMASWGMGLGTGLRRVDQVQRVRKQSKGKPKNKHSAGLGVTASRCSHNGPSGVTFPPLTFGGPLLECTVCTLDQNGGQCPYQTPQASNEKSSIRNGASSFAVVGQWCSRHHRFKTLLLLMAGF